MRRLLKSVLRAMWRSTLPFRRPFLRKVNDYLARSLHPTERLLAEHLGASRALADETTILMDQIIRELVRVRRQVEELQQAVDELSGSQTGPTIAGEIEASERLKAG